MVLNEVVLDTQEDRTSAYESINENEMLPFPLCVAFGDNSSNLDDEAFASVRSSIRGKSSSSENSYLEVIDNDSYLNPYQPIEFHQDSEIVHNYSKIASINYLDLCFPKFINLIPEDFSHRESDIIIEHHKSYSLPRSGMNEIKVSVCNGLRDDARPSTAESLLKSHEINSGYLDKSSFDRNKIDEKTARSDKPDIIVSNDVCMFQGKTMSSLL
ncbi:Hypothetical predicted protein [Mytilus galloprovincialis]|uniref:Uncharacterized protein n=1 Tax=Mytilus galloprovincialis TaxID=29158 RepID=A0A8B6FUK8_MYTGA|nr:Hypothetical predicted protein [Mytilus galloprovincialis]